MIFSGKNPKQVSGLVENASWVFLGNATPMLIGLAAFPLLIARLGVERFGVLGIVWAVAGYFSLFDLGLGRTLTKMVSDHLGLGDRGAPPQLIWTALWLIGVFGVLGGVILFVVAPYVVSAFHLGGDLEKEAAQAFRCLSFSIPVVVMSSAIVGILEAYHCFRQVARIRMMIGSLNFLFPVLISLVNPSLFLLTMGIIGLRTISLLLFWRLAREVEPALLSPSMPASGRLRPLLDFGGWLTVSNIVNPLMLYFDRFVIGTMLGASAVAYYTPPFEVLSRLQMLPQSLMSALFPALSLAHQRGGERGVRLFASAATLSFLVVFPLLAVIFIFAFELLGVWLGSEYATNSYVIARWMALGWLLNMFSRPAYTWLQSLGRADLTAKTHFFEFPVFVVFLYFSVIHSGIEGAAFAWFVRMFLETLVLNELARRCSPQLSIVINMQYLRIFAVAIGSVVLLEVNSIICRLVIIFLVIICFSVAGYLYFRRWRNSLEISVN